MPPTTKKATPAPAKKPAPEPKAPRQDFCPQPHICFPAGLPDDVTWAGCEHGEWAL